MDIGFALFPGHRLCRRQDKMSWSEHRTVVADSSHVACSHHKDTSSDEATSRRSFGQVDKNRIVGREDAPRFGNEFCYPLIRASRGTHASLAILWSYRFIETFARVRLIAYLMLIYPMLHHFVHLDLHFDMFFGYPANVAALERTA